jgi:primosomal protein N' (replication factor Y)
VVELHDRTPRKSGKPVQIKKVLRVIDSAPVLDEQLLNLGKWIANYYLAPIGEVFRTMLPLSIEFKRAIAYRIAEIGRAALHHAGLSGSSARSRRTPEEQSAEFRVLDYLANYGDSETDDHLPGVSESALRSAARISRPVLAGMVRKKWISREDVSTSRDITRTTRIAVLKAADGKLNANQRNLIETLVAAGGRVPIASLRGLDVPTTTLGTLVRRGLVEFVEVAATFSVSRSQPRRSPFTFDFSSAQQSALDRLRDAVASRKFTGILMHGVTGSGKTAVYLAGMRAVLDAGRSAILLVPEIGLTPAVAADLHQTFGSEVAILHSALSGAERAEQWHRIKRGQARIVVGTRSAVFAPVADLALILVDEEQDSSYKQEETPRYHARDVAVMRAKMAGATVVLGSATPSLESYFNAKKNKYDLVELPDRVEQRPLPEVEIVDMRQEFQETGHEQVISRKLATEIKDRLERHEQVMVLLNRRGYSPVVMCRSCG